MARVIVNEVKAKDVLTGDKIVSSRYDGAWGTRVYVVSRKVRSAKPGGHWERTTQTTEVGRVRATAPDGSCVIEYETMRNETDKDKVNERIQVFGRIPLALLRDRGWTLDKWVKDC